MSGLEAMLDADAGIVIYAIGYVLFVAIRARYAQGGLAGAVPTHLERVLLALTGLGVMVIPVAFALTRMPEFANYAPAPIQIISGTALMAASLMLFHRAHRDLGRNFSPTLALQTDHVLVTSGVYSSIRHPIYAAIWLFAAAQALLLANWMAGASGLIGFAPMYFLRVPREEAMLREAFGNAWDDYVARTGRIFPRLQK